MCHQRGRRQVAQAQARRPLPADLPVAGGLALRSDCAFEVIADLLRTRQPAGDVVADMRHHRWSWRGRVQGIERGDTVGLRRRHSQATRDVVQGRLADPADPILDGVERRKQLRPAGPDGVASARGVAVDARPSLATDPARVGRPQDAVDRRTLDGGRERPDDVQVHRPECSRAWTTWTQWNATAAGSGDGRPRCRGRPCVPYELGSASRCQAERLVAGKGAGRAAPVTGSMNNGVSGSPEGFQSHDEDRHVVGRPLGRRVAEERLLVGLDARSASVRRDDRGRDRPGPVLAVAADHDQARPVVRPPPEVVPIGARRRRQGFLPGPIGHHRVGLAPPPPGREIDDGVRDPLPVGRPDRRDGGSCPRWLDEVAQAAAVRVHEEHPDFVLIPGG